MTAPDAADCVGYFKLENNLDDATGLTSDTSNNGATYNASGVIGSGLETDGSATTFFLSGYEQPYFASNSAPRTISFWLYAPAAISFGTFFYHRNNSGLFHISVFSGNFRSVVYYEGGSITLSSSIPLVVEQWHHIVIDYNGSDTYRFFVDGVLGGETNSIPAPLNGGNSSGWEWGDGIYGNTAVIFDEIALFDVVLTSDNRSFLNASGSPGSSQQYPFSAGPSGTVYNPQPLLAFGGL